MTDQKYSMEKLPLVQHLIELRRSLLRSVIAITIFFVVLFPFADEIYNFIADPIVQAIPGSNLIAIGVISPFLTPLKMSLILAIYIAMPYLLYQLWMFVAPALYRHEKRLVLPLVVSSTLLFYAGIVFSFYIVFPVIFGFLAGVGPDSVNFAPDIQYYLDFILKVSFAFGVAFEVPVVTILLIIFGVTTPQKLKKKPCCVDDVRLHLHLSLDCRAFIVHHVGHIIWEFLPLNLQALLENSLQLSPRALMNII